MGETGEEFRGKNKNGFGLKIFLACLVFAIIGLAIAIIVVGNNKNESEVTLEEYYNEYFKEVDEIYDNNSDNIMKVVDYFIEEANSNAGDYETMNAIISSEFIWFNRKNINDKEPLLEGLMKVDFSGLLDMEVSVFYIEIIDLAKELGKNDIVKQYRSLLNDVKTDYVNDLKISRKNLEEMLKNENMPEETRKIIQEQYDFTIKKIKEIEEEDE